MKGQIGSLVAYRKTIFEPEMEWIFSAESVEKSAHFNRKNTFSEYLRNPLTFSIFASTEKRSFTHFGTEPSSGTPRSGLRVDRGKMTFITY